MKEKDNFKSGPPDTGFAGKLSDYIYSRSFSYGIILIPVIALVILVFLIFIFSDNPFRTLFFFFAGPFRNIFSLSNMLNASVPLILGALGVIIAMKSGSLNLGGEGQVYLGAFVTTAIALQFSYLHELPADGRLIGFIGAVTALVIGSLCSGALAAISGFCKAQWNTTELITTFLLSYAVIHVVNYLVTGPFLDPETSLISTKKIAENMRLPFIIKQSGLSSGIFIALIFVFIVHVFLSKTKLGYEFRMAGLNELFARYGGINTKLNTVLAFLFSGCLYGFAGGVTILGTHFAVVKEFSAGLGWNGLAAALIARFYPPAVIPAALFFAWLGSGARIAMQNTGLTADVASIVQAVILFLSTSLVLLNMKKKRMLKNE